MDVVVCLLLFWARIALGQTPKELPLPYGAHEATVESTIVDVDVVVNADEYAYYKLPLLAEGETFVQAWSCDGKIEMYGGSIGDPSLPTVASHALNETSFPLPLEHVFPAVSNETIIGIYASNGTKAIFSLRWSMWKEVPSSTSNLLTVKDVSTMRAAVSFVPMKRIHNNMEGYHKFMRTIEFAWVASEVKEETISFCDKEGALQGEWNTHVWPFSGFAADKRTEIAETEYVLIDGLLPGVSYWVGLLVRDTASLMERVYEPVQITTKSGEEKRTCTAISSDMIPFCPMVEYAAAVEGESGLIESLQVRRSLNAVEVVLFRFDCDVQYSVFWGCQDCREAYAKWICGTLLPMCKPEVAVNTSLVDWKEHTLPVCQPVCYETVQRCPYVMNLGCGERKKDVADNRCSLVIEIGSGANRACGYERWLLLLLVLILLW